MDNCQLKLTNIGVVVDLPQHTQNKRQNLHRVEGSQRKSCNFVETLNHYSIKIQITVYSPFRWFFKTKGPAFKSSRCQQ